MDERKLLGRRVKELRRERGWSQEHLAELMEIAPSYVSAIERGRCNPTLDLLVKLTHALKVDLVSVFNFAWFTLTEAELRKGIRAMADKANVERLREMFLLLKAREL